MLIDFDKIEPFNIKENENINLSMLNNYKVPINFQRIKSADWAVEREGLINLKDPRSIEKKITNGKEAISIYFYNIEHPIFGRYMIDSGISSIFTKDKKEWPINSIVQKFMNTDELKIIQTTSDFNKTQSKKLEGIFLTHMHIDHILGLRDLSSEIPIYTGKNEAHSKSFQNIIVSGTTDNLLEGKINLKEFEFSNFNNELGLKVLDFFGDNSLLILSVPGHTKGSLAFIVNSTTGSHLILGDTCHTKFGWEENVIPGKYPEDPDLNRKSLTQLKNISIKYPNLKIYPGHQSL